MKAKIILNILLMIAIPFGGIPFKSTHSAIIPVAPVSASTAPSLTTFTKVVTGGEFSCALTSEGGVKCWGFNGHGQLGDGTTTNRSYPVDVVGLSSGVTALAAGAAHTCAVSSGGAAKCWGNNGWGQLGDGTYWGVHSTPVDVVGLSSGVITLAAGAGHTCAVTSGGAVKCWGYGEFGQLGDGIGGGQQVTPVDVVGLSSGVTTLTAGSYHTCAVISNGAVKCWGYNWDGQLGDGSHTNRITPIDVVGLSSGTTTVAAGEAHTCAVTISGNIRCWGANWNGQLGDGTITQSSTPVDVVGLSSGATALAAGSTHTCAVIRGGAVECWGDNSSGQLGDGSTTHHSTPVDVIGLSSGVTTLAGGSAHTCAVMSDGMIKCWGNNPYGQLGNSLSERSIPVDVAGLATGVIAMTTGGNHTCTVTSGGMVQCWGRNRFGGLGDGTLIHRNTPGDVVGLISPATALAAGEYHTCAIGDNGALQCWGYNVDGELGDGSTTDRTTPVDVSGLTHGVTAVAAGWGHTCALAGGGAAKCWGYNGFGQLGDGSMVKRSAPVDVVGLTSGVTALAAGSYHTCAVIHSGAVKCWGINRYGELGDGTTTQRNTPVDVVELSSEVIALAAGEYHTCALTSSGAVKCWGNNGDGQLGDGSSTDRATPVDVIGLTSGVTALAARGYNTCALTSSGAVKCWGTNQNGQIGDGTTISRSIPVDVIGLSSGVTGLAAGDHHTCALIAPTGRVKCFGWDGFGQLGTGASNQSLTPENVVFSTPFLTLNYPAGQPGSVFTLTGWNFPPGAQAALSINNQIITSDLAINETGSFLVFLDTAGADPGKYFVTVRVTPSTSDVEMFVLDDTVPLRPQEGGGAIVDVPPGVAYTQSFYISVILRKN